MPRVTERHLLAPGAEGQVSVGAPLRRKNSLARPTQPTSHWSPNTDVEARTLTEASELPLEAELCAHASSMWALARRLAGPGAEDVVQDAYERAWRLQDTFDPRRGTRRAWLLMLVADRHRSWRRRLRFTHDLGDYPSVSVDQELRLDLGQAIAKLPPRQRLAVELHYVLGLPVEETAQAMRCAPGTVKSTLSDARRRLRPALEATHD